MTASAGLDGRAGLAYRNAVGGLAAQTAALAVADLFYRHANLEHAAASLFNMVSGVLLIMLLAVGAALTFVPNVTIWNVHIGTPVLVAVYVFGLRFMRRVGANRYGSRHTHQPPASTSREAMTTNGRCEHCC